MYCRTLIQQVQVSVGVVNVGSVNVGGVSAASAGVRKQEQYRSHSLPIGAQLTADWTVSTPTSAHVHDSPSTHSARVSEPNYYENISIMYS